MSLNSHKIIKSIALLLVTTMSLTLGGFVHAQSSTITSSSATSISGTATPTSGSTITAVDIAVRTGTLYWNGTALQSGWTRVAATVTGNTWSYSFSSALPDAIYYVSVRAFDSSGSVQSPFTYGSIVLDNVSPTSSINAGGTSSTNINGIASDNTGGSGLNRVEISIRNGSQYWNGSSFTSTYARVVTSLTGGSWDYDISTALPSGTYNLGVVAFDNAGNYQYPFTNASFTVGDSIKPGSTITSTSATQITGGATDNSSVGSVELAISNGTGFWNGAIFTGYNRVQATIVGSGTSVTWSYGLSTTLPDGNYSVTAIAFDSAGNAQASPFTRSSFVVETAPPLKILALGDSITAGYDADTTDGILITSYRADFEVLLDATDCNYEMVGSVLSNDPNPTYFESPHEGYSGHRVDQFLTGYLTNPGIDSIMAAEMPDVVLMHLGSNDLFINEPVQSTVFEISDVVGRIFSANPDVIILLANVIPWYGTSQYNSDIRADIELLGDGVISLIQGIASPQLRLANVRNGFYPSFMQSDGIHPNPAGEVLIAERFLESLDQSGACGVAL